MTVTLLDRFAGTLDTGLAAHTPDVGSQWTVVTNGGVTADGNKLTGTGKVYRPAAAGSYMSATQPQADYGVWAEVDVDSILASDAVVIYARAGSATNHYYLQILQSGAVTYGKKVSNTDTVLGTVTLTLTQGGRVSVGLVVVGTAIKGYANGTQIGTTSTDSSHTAAGFAGLRVGGGSSTVHTVSTGLHPRAIGATTAASAPAALLDPVITGTNTVGQTLTCTQGSWADLPTGYAYQWYRGASAITGATASTYPLVSDDAGQSITCRVSATNGSGSTTVASNAIVIAGGAPANTVAPVISTDGTPQVDETVTCGTGTWTGGPTFAYQWQRDGVNIGGATLATRKIAQADKTHSLQCIVSGTNGSGTVSATSNAITPAAEAAPVNTVPPSLTGTPVANQTLTVVDGTWTGSDIVYTRSVQRSTDGGSTYTTITGTGGGTYVVQRSDEGSKLRAAVTATNDAGGQSTTANSSPVDIPVVPAMQATDLAGRYSGGTGNSDQTASIGGGPGATHTPTGGYEANLLTGAIPGSAASAGATYYRGLYQQNNHTVESLTDPRAYVKEQYTAPGLSIAVGAPVDTSSDLPTLASGTTAPPGVAFSTATTALAGPSLGAAIPPGGRRGYWVRITVSPGSTGITGAQAKFAVSGTPSG